MRPLAFVVTLLLVAAPLCAAPANAPKSGPSDALTHEAVVSAPLSRVWDAYTTKAGIQAWMVAQCDIELKVGGRFRTHYSKEGVLGDAGTIEHRILALDPQRMLAYRTVKCPQKFPFARAIEAMWTVLYFEPVDATHTKVVCRCLGFTPDEESQKMRTFFDRGNAYEFEELKKHFAPAAK
jgi:uncharacterized protein YndB with AHSA1/START domain